MYCGPGSGPMLAAAAAWDGVAVELGLAATGYASVIAELTGAPWVGAASLSMVAAATPYVAWLSQAAARAEQAGMQAAAAAAAYEAAFVMTVPPPVITANRVLVMTLIATNFFGQNSAAIAVAEAQYAEMWAQDAVAMYGYAAASASASRLIPFAAPPKTTNSAGVVAQAGRTRGCLLRSTPETSRRLRSQIRESPDSPGRFTTAAANAPNNGPAKTGIAPKIFEIIQPILSIASSKTTANSNSGTRTNTPNAKPTVAKNISIIPVRTSQGSKFTRPVISSTNPTAQASALFIINSPTSVNAWAAISKNFANSPNGNGVMVAAATALLASLAPGLTMTGAGPVCGVASGHATRCGRHHRWSRRTLVASRR